MLSDADEGEIRLELTAALGAVVLLQLAMAIVSLAKGWTLLGVPGWLWLAATGPEIALYVALALHVNAKGTSEMAKRRRLALWLGGVIVALNLTALVLLIGSLLTSHEHSGTELIFKAMVIWTTNVIAFGLLYWELDAGGPARRLLADEHHHDFQFPQNENPQLAEPGWHPRIFDYVYVSFTDSIAFSPTDAMPLTRRAKALMLLESAISATTVLLALARAVNILG